MADISLINTSSDEEVSINNFEFDPLEYIKASSCETPISENFEFEKERNCSEDLES